MHLCKRYKIPHISLGFFFTFHNSNKALLPIVTTIIKRLHKKLTTETKNATKIASSHLLFLPGLDQRGKEHSLGKLLTLHKLFQPPQHPGTGVQHRVSPSLVCVSFPLQLPCSQLYFQMEQAIDKKIVCVTEEVNGTCTQLW